MLNFYPHLTIRNHTYYARFSVPKHLVKIAKRKNFFYSLFTKDYYQALHKVKESYEHFTDDELAKIFDWQTYPQCVDKDTPLLHPEYFWIPLIALFIGARLNELCQLDCEDIQKHGGISCISIFPDDNTVLVLMRRIATSDMRPPHNDNAGFVSAWKIAASLRSSQ